MLRGKSRLGGRDFSVLRWQFSAGCYQLAVPSCRHPVGSARFSDRSTRFDFSREKSRFSLTNGVLPLEWTVLNKLNSALRFSTAGLFLCCCSIIQVVFLHRRKYTQFTLIAPLIVIFYVAGYHIYQRLSARISVQIVSFSL